MAKSQVKVLGNKICECGLIKPKWFPKPQFLYTKQAANKITVENSCGRFLQ